MSRTACLAALVALVTSFSPLSFAYAESVMVTPAHALPGAMVQIQAVGCAKTATTVTATSPGLDGYATLTKSGTAWQGTARVNPYATAGLKSVYVYCHGGPFAGEFHVSPAIDTGSEGRGPWLIGAVVVLVGTASAAATAVRRRRRPALS